MSALIDIYEQFRDWASTLWLYDQQGTVTAKKISAVARYCATEKGVRHFFIDSLMKCVAGRMTTTDRRHSWTS